MFEEESRMALEPVQGNWASSHSEGEVSLFFSSCSENQEYILEFR